VSNQKCKTTNRIYRGREDLGNVSGDTENSCFKSKGKKIYRLGSWQEKGALERKKKNRTFVNGKGKKPQIIKRGREARREGNESVSQ